LTPYRSATLARAQALPRLEQQTFFNVNFKVEAILTSLEQGLFWPHQEGTELGFEASP
jgi:hypothetical protein